MEKLTRRIRDLKNLEITTVQMKSTDAPPPSPKKRLRKQTEKSTNPLSHPLIEELKRRWSDSLNWRERSKETKEEEIKFEAKRTKIPKTIIEEEIDEDQWKTYTLNPTDIHETTIISQIENKDKQEDDLLISYIKQENPNEIWIKAKKNLAMDLAIE